MSTRGQEDASSLGKLNHLNFAQKLKIKRNIFVTLKKKIHLKY